MGHDKVRLKIQVDHTKSLIREFAQLTCEAENIPPKKPKYVKAEFQPEYWEEHYESDTAINAIIEIRAIWQYVIQEAYYNYSNIYSQLSIPISERVKMICKEHKEAFAVYDTKTQRWLIEPAESVYKFCYNGEFFEEFKDGKNRTTVENSMLLLVGKYTILKQEVNLLTETKTAPTLLETFVMPRTSLTVGVPGCGKTTHIIDNHSYGNLVLTSCAEGAQDVRSRMAKIKGGQPSDYRNSYRTIDSYLLNSRTEYSHVWVDEALMEHPGKLFLVCLFSRCRSLTLLGDPNQLGYINRVNAIRLRYDKSSKFFKPTKTLNISYRCPVDVMAVLSSKYDGQAFSASNVLRSLKYKSFTTLKDVPKVANTKYLVFKQAEKKQMQRAGYDVSTIHEFQGKESRNVILVRMSYNLREALYKSAPHILVGITRHRESLIYFTPVTDDVVNIIVKSQANTELKKYQITTLASKSSDYTNTSDSFTSNNQCLPNATSVAFNSRSSTKTGTFPSINSITPQRITPVASNCYMYHENTTSVESSSRYSEKNTSVVSNNFNRPQKPISVAFNSPNYSQSNTYSTSNTINRHHANSSSHYNYSNNDQNTNIRSDHRETSTPLPSNRRFTPCCCIL